MKTRFFRRVTAFAVASFIAGGVITIFPEAKLSVSATNTGLSNYIDKPEIATTSLNVFIQGDGSIENPYQVSTPEQLNAVRSDLTANYIQVNDIDLSRFSNWEPIGEGDELGISGGATHMFTGNYNGNGYKISNMTISNSSHRFVGLFGYASEASLSNITLNNVSIDIDLISKDYTMNQQYELRLGSIAGICNEVSNCFVSGNISVINSHTVILGGVIGNGCAQKCTNYCNISIISNRDGSDKNDSNVHVGGIVGTAKDDIIYCLNYGNINATAGRHLHMGGISGSNGGISYCINYGTIKGITTKRVDLLTTQYCHVGGISGDYSSTMRYCANLGDIYASSNSGNSRAAEAGGITAIAGWESSTMIYNKKISNCYNAAKRIESIAHKENNGVYEPFYCSAKRISTIINTDWTDECYSIESTLVNGVIVTEEVGTNQKNGESKTNAFINEKILQILSIINDNINNDNKVETTYIVSWVNDDGKTIYTEEVNVGENPTYNTEKWGTPVSSTGNVFKGWANIPETENNIVIPVFSSTDTSYTGNGGDITYYAIYGDFVNVKWYNGNTLLEDNYCKENTVPVYGGEIPKCYDYEYGLVRKFLGWTTANNSNYSITISDKLVPVTEDTIYYAVFSEEEPVADDSMNMDIDKIDYIEQHITSASAKEWTKLNQAILLKDTVENSTLEVTHGIWKTVAITDKVVNLDYMGIYGEISANDYNLILLDMFNSVEGYETVSSIIKESSYSGIKDWANILKKSLTKVFGDDLKLDKDLNKAFNTFDKEPTYQNMLNLIDETNAFCEKNNMDLSEIVVSQSLLEMYELTNDVLSGINLAVSTLKDVIENAETIAAYRTYQNMSQEYLDLLIDLYKEADNISSNSWEVADLKNAIRYQIYYYAYPDEATLKSMVNIIAKNLIQVFSGDIDDIIKDHTINFIQKTFTKDVTASSKYLKGEIGTYLAAVQNGFKYGVKISDKLFDMNNREELYIKIKEYGVLNEILYKVLDSKANKLLSAKTMDEQYSAANYYDKAYKMYFFIESVACKNAGEYEKTFELPDGIKRALQKYIGTDLIYNILYNESLDEAAARHAEMATIYNNYANFINRNLHCHYGYKIGADEYVDILLNYSQTMKDHKVAIISCPVQVNVYDENKSLVGTLSSQYTNVKQGYEIYMYRIEETDSNVVCVPMDYTIEVIGLDNGAMNVIAGYFDGNEQLNTVSYNNVPIDSEYRAIVNIDEKTSDLSENVPNSPSHTTPSMPSIDNTQGTSSSTNAIPTNSSKSTTFNVKVENKITNKTTKVKATRTGENVTINLGKDNNGYYANAYTSDAKLIDAVKIKSGKAKFTIPNDIDFYIIVDEASHLNYEDVSSGAGIHELLNETTTLLCITVIIIITVVGCLSIVAIKRFDKNKH